MDLTGNVLRRIIFSSFQQNISLLQIILMQKSLLFTNTSNYVIIVSKNSSWLNRESPLENDTIFFQEKSNNLIIFEIFLWYFHSFEDFTALLKLLIPTKDTSNYKINEEQKNLGIIILKSSLNTIIMGIALIFLHC